MINVRNSARMRRREAEVNMSPLIDLVFLLLIFFMVTTSFVRETGVEVARPSASTATLTKAGNILIAVSQDGNIFFDKKRIDIRSVRSYITRALAENPEGSVIIIADKVSHTGMVIEVMDQCRLAGAKQISIAASRKGS